MGRTDGFLLLWNHLLVAVGITPRPWLLPACIFVLAALAWPLVRRTQGISRARKLLADAERTSGAERRAIQEQVLSLVGDHPMGLVGVIEEALRRQQAPLAAEALERLRETRKEPIHLLRLEAKVHGPPPTSIEAELAAIDRLLEAALTAQAVQRLDRARRRWPQEPRLAAVQVPTDPG